MNYSCSLTAMNKPEACCDNLIEATAVALNGDVVPLMLVAVQKHNLESSVDIALKWSVHQFKGTGWDSHQAVQGLFYGWA